MPGEIDRREFVKLTGAGGVAAAAGWNAIVAGQTPAAPGPDAGERADRREGRSTR